MYFNELTIRYGLSNILTLNESVSYNVTSYSFKTFKLFGWVLTDVTAADFLERTKRLRLVYVLEKIIMYCIIPTIWKYRKIFKVLQHNIL